MYRGRKIATEKTLDYKKQAHVRMSPSGLTLITPCFRGKSRSVQLEQREDEKNRFPSDLPSTLVRNTRRLN